MNWEIFKRVVKYQQIRSYLFLTALMSLLIVPLITDKTLQPLIALTCMIVIALTAGQLVTTETTLKAADKKLRNELSLLARRSVDFWLEEAAHKPRTSSILMELLLLAAIRFSLLFGADQQNLWSTVAKVDNHLYLKTMFKTSWSMCSAALNRNMVGDDQKIARRFFDYLIPLVLDPARSEIDKDLQELLRIFELLVGSGIPFDSVYDIFINVQNELIVEGSQPRRSLWILFKEPVKDFQGTGFLTMGRSDSAKRYVVAVD